MSKQNTEAKASKGKKALNIALIVLQVAIVIVAIAFSISILLSTGYDSNTDFGKSSIRLMPVLTDSMNGDKEDSFKAGDLIIVKSADKADVNSLEVGDIVTYLDYVGSDLQFVTHRIVSVREEDQGDNVKVKIFETMGDAETSGITKTLYSGDIKGVYVGKLAGVGTAVFWLQDPTHFFLVIMLPLILLLIYNAYLVVRLVMEHKLRKQREELAGATGAGSAPLDEEEIKRRAVEEYIRQKAIEDYKKEQNAVNGQPAAAAEEQAGTKTDSAVQAEEKAEVRAEEAPAVPVEAPAQDTQEEPAEEEEAPAEQKAEETPAEQEESTPVADGEAPAQDTQEIPAEEKEAPADQKAEGPAPVVEKAEKAEESKPAAKKTTAKKSSANVTAAKKPAASAEKKSAAKKPASKSAAGKTAAKKPAAKATASKSEAKPAASKSTAKKTTKKTTE